MIKSINEWTTQGCDVMNNSRPLMQRTTQGCGCN